jgi:hypothetical protein
MLFWFEAVLMEKMSISKCNSLHICHHDNSYHPCFLYSFPPFRTFGSLQSKWRLILCVTCFGLTEFVSVRQIFTSCQTKWTLFFQLFGCLSTGLEVIKLRLETSLKPQASDWLKWLPVAISASQMLEI